MSGIPIETVLIRYTYSFWEKKTDWHDRIQVPIAQTEQFGFKFSSTTPRDFPLGNIDVIGTYCSDGTCCSMGYSCTPSQYKFCCPVGSVLCQLGDGTCCDPTKTCLQDQSGNPGCWEFILNLGTLIYVRAHLLYY